MKLNPNKIRLEMARKSLTRKQVLVDSGISCSTWHHANKTGRANASTIGRIAKAIGCDVLDIIDAEGTKV